MVESDSMHNGSRACTGIKEIPMPDLDFCTRTLGGQIVLRSYEHGFLGAVSKGKFLGGV
jgi:hypothetical protein